MHGTNRKEGNQKDGEDTDQEATSLENHDDPLGQRRLARLQTPMKYIELGHVILMIGWVGIQANIFA